MGVRVAWKAWSPFSSTVLPDERGLYALVLVEPDELGSQIAYIGCTGAKSARTLRQRLPVKVPKDHAVRCVCHHCFGVVLEVEEKGKRIWLHHPFLDWSKETPHKPYRLESSRYREVRFLLLPQYDGVEIGKIENWLLWLHYNQYKHFPRLNRKCPEFRKPAGKPPTEVWKRLLDKATSFNSKAMGSSRRPKRQGSK